MNLQKRIKAFAELGAYLKSEPQQLQPVIQRAYQENKWFTPENIQYALANIAGFYLNENELRQWAGDYTIPDERPLKRVGLVMAGNIPLAGFHDLLSVLITGNIAVIKPSSKDKVLPVFLLEKLVDIEPAFNEQLEVAHQIKQPDAMIATGSNNSARYFEYYFGKYPHIIRKNRNSAAVLTGNETQEYLDKLGEDIFRYFGLGCRNVSKLYLPQGYDPQQILNHLMQYSWVMEHNKYQNNFNYNRSIYVLNKTAYLASDFLILLEKKELASPVSTLHFEFYNDKKKLKEHLLSQKEQIQCIAAPAGEEYPEGQTVSFGATQQPRLTDYADNVDVVEFLLSL